MGRSTRSSRCHPLRMRKLLLLLPLLLAAPAAADMGYDFYGERANTLLDNVAAGTEALKANDINLMCLEYGFCSQDHGCLHAWLREALSRQSLDEIQADLAERFCKVRV